MLLFKEKTIFYFLVIFNVVMAIETPEYRLISREGKFELRKYDSFLIAKTTVENDYKEATVTGFRRIANYIFGGNKSQLSINMTAPVIANVPNKEGIYNIIFVMPREHTLSSLPQPNNDQVKIENYNFGKTAVVKFGGWATNSRTKYYKSMLEEYLREKEFISSGKFLVAQYNSPYALPPFRKNEIIVPIK